MRQRKRSQRACEIRTRATRRKRDRKLTLVLQCLFQRFLYLAWCDLGIETDKSANDAPVARDDKTLRNTRAALHHDLGHFALRPTDLIIDIELMHKIANAPPGRNRIFRWEPAHLDPP